MNWNFLTTSYRFILRGKSFTAINLFGLTAGLTVSFFLLIYIINELNYDSFPRNHRRVYRILTHTREHSTPLSPAHLPAVIRSEVPGVESFGQLVALHYYTHTIYVKQGETLQEGSGFICADPEILDMLTIKGVPETAKESLRLGSSVLLSESAARSCFGETDVTGKALEMIIDGAPLILTVTGIFEDLPWNSSLQVNYIAGMDLFYNLLQQYGIDLENEQRACADYYAEMFIQVDNPDRVREIADHLPSLLDSLGLTAEGVTFAFQNIRDIHLDPAPLSNDFHLKGNRTALFYYGSLALFILLLAGINYSILNTARSALRFKEVGVRKVLGATRGNLRIQILAESMTLTFLALPLSLLVLGLLEPFVHRLYGYEIELYTWTMLIYLPLFALITLFIGFLSGGYLAFYLSALNPLKAIRNEIFTRQRFSLNKIFIVFQLLITLSLFIAVLIIFSQLNYCLHGKQGVKKENLLIVGLNPPDLQHYPVLRDQTRRLPGVLSVSGSSIIPPTNASSRLPFTLTDSSLHTIYVENYYIDSDFFTTLGIEILTGTDLKTTGDLRPGQTTLMNQEAVSALNLRSPVDTLLGTYHITGTVRDFNIHSLYSKITPAIFVYHPGACRYLILKHRPGEETHTRKAIGEIWDSLAPGTPVQISTFGEELELMYNREQKFAQVVASFSFLAFIITGMGLFGLALLLVERRLKEIAIRKIFGASNRHILFRMLKEFFIYTGFASLVAIPVTWYVMNQWLSSFYYKITLQGYLFFIAVVSITIFVSSIILLRTLTVLRKNLINVLRYE